MISSGFPPKIETGAEKFCYNLAKKLIENNIDVEVASDVDMKNYDGIKLYKLNKVKSKISRKLFFDYYYPRNRFLLKKIIKEANPDIIHFHNIYGISSSLVKQAANIKPTVITVHDYWPICFLSTLTIDNQECDFNCKKCRYPLSKITNKIKKRHLSKAILVAPSQFMQKKLHEMGFDNAYHIYNGITVDKKLTPLNRRLLFVGRLTEEKGIVLLLESLKETNENIDIVGNGPLLEKLKSKYKDYINIRFHGFVEDISLEYKKGGILIFPSLWVENLPYVLLEAMSYGLPIIATNIGSLPDIVIDNKTGLLFNHTVNEDLLNKVSNLINNEDIQIELRKNALEFLKNNFKWKVVIKKYVELYSDLIE